MEWFVDAVVHHVADKGHWFAWNTTLGAVPWVLAVFLFRTGRRLRVLWWIGFVAFVAFLPNAAYTVTDLIHVPKHVRREPSDSVAIAIVVPMFVALAAVGLAMHLDAVRRLGRWAVGEGWISKRWPLQMAVHALVAVGVYLGRVHRFNSWELVSQPTTIVETFFLALLRPRPVIFMGSFFAMLVAAHLASLPTMWFVESEGRTRRPASPDL
jgi:uncharacterized membrane protein